MPARISIIGFMLSLVLGCFDSLPDDPGPLGPPCHFPEDCAEGSRCTSAGAIPEAVLEPTDKGICLPNAQVVGSKPLTWAWQTGGRPLAERLCICQGMARGSSAAADALRLRQKAMLQASGVRMIRLHVRWRNVERSRGQFDFSADDGMIDAAIEAGLEPLVVLAYGNPWATAAAPAGEDKYPPDSNTDFATYAARTAEHFAGRVTHYEIWNEPNAGYRFWMPEIPGDAEAFGALQAEAAAAVKGACPTCTVTSAGLFFHAQIIPGAVEFLHDLLSADPSGLAAIDAVGFHPYPIYPPVHAPEFNAEGERAIGGMSADLRAVLKHHGLEHLPLAITELGWPVYSSTDETRQSAWLTRSVLLAAALGSDPICWYNLENGDNEGAFPPEDDFGLYRHGRSLPGAPIDPKPARDAMAWLARVGAGSTLIGAVADVSLHAPDAGRFGLEFTAPHGSWRVLWSLEEHAPASITAGSNLVFDHLGNRLTEVPSTTGPEPIFLLTEEP